MDNLNTIDCNGLNGFYVLIYKHKQGSVMEHETREYFSSLTSLFEYLSKIKFDLQYYYVGLILDSYCGNSCL